MRKMKNRIFSVVTLTFFFLQFFLLSASALEIPLTIEEPAGVARTSEPVTSGVPLPPNTQTTTWALFDGAQQIPVQITRLPGRTPWILLDFQIDVPASGKKTLTLRDTASTVTPSRPLTISEDATQITVVTGPLKVLIKKNLFNLFDAVWVDKDNDGVFASTEQTVISSGNNIQFVDATSGQTFSGAGAPDQVTWEYRGPQRATLRIDGRYRNGTGELLTYTTRLSFSAGAAAVKIEHVLRNSVQANERHVKIRSAIIKLGSGTTTIRATRPGSISWGNIGTGGLSFELVPPLLWGIDTTANGGMLLTDLSHHGATLIADFSPGLSTAEQTRRTDAAKSPLFALAAPSWYSAYGELSTSRFSTLEDEKQAYQKWGWAWTATQEPKDAHKPDYSVSWKNVGTHDDSEADDVWQNILMYVRTGQRGYWDRTMGWVRHYKWDYAYRTDGFSYAWDGDVEHPQVSRPLISIPLTTTDDAYLKNTVKPGKVDMRGWNADHLWGWGLIDYYYLTGDIDALSAAKDLGELSNRVYDWRSPGYTMSFYGPRQGARHFLLSIRLYEATLDPHWQETMNHLAQLWLQSPDWDPRGFYAQAPTPEGRRVVAVFQLGFLSWAFDRYYTVTGATQFRDRLVAMAQWAKQYGLHQSYHYSGSRIALDWPSTGKVWHNNFDDGVTILTSFSPYATLNVIDTLARGYRLSGDTTLLDRAKYHWNQASKTKNGLPITRSVTDTQVGRFINSRFSSGGNIYADNGDISYVSLLFYDEIHRITAPPPPSPSIPASPLELQVK